MMTIETRSIRNPQFETELQPAFLMEELVEEKLVWEEIVGRESTWPPPQGEWTYEDYRRLPSNGLQYEVIHGRLIMIPAPTTTHQAIVMRLGAAFFNFLRLHPLGEVFPAPIDVVAPGMADPVQPDLVFVASERMDIVTERAIEGVPDLVVEVLSPSNWIYDRRLKFALYAEIGVQEYWIVDPEERTVEVFSFKEGDYELQARFAPGGLLCSEFLPGFEMAVDDIFPR